MKRKPFIKEKVVYRTPGGVEFDSKKAAYKNWAAVLCYEALNSRGSEKMRKACERGLPEGVTSKVANLMMKIDETPLSDYNTTASDVEAYVWSRIPSVDKHFVEKLVYYSQAWHLVWEDKPMFNDCIEASSRGPSIPSLFMQNLGDRDVLTEEERRTVDAVIERYKNKTGQWLKDLSKREKPWVDVRNKLKLSAGERCEEVITHAAMDDYYSSIYRSDSLGPAQELTDDILQQIREESTKLVAVVEKLTASLDGFL